MITGSYGKTRQLLNRTTRSLGLRGSRLCIDAAKELPLHTRRFQSWGYGFCARLDEHDGVVVCGGADRHLLAVR